MSACGSESSALITPDEQATAYVLTGVNTKSNPPEFIMDSGVAVDAYFCTECGHIELFHHKD